MCVGVGQAITEESEDDGEGGEVIDLDFLEFLRDGKPKMQVIPQFRVGVQAYDWIN